MAGRSTADGCRDALRPLIADVKAMTLLGTASTAAAARVITTHKVTLINDLTAGIEVAHAVENGPI